MKNIIIISAIASVLTIAFLVSLDWAIHFDYPINSADYYPVAITWFLGVFAFATTGGIFGAISEYKEAK